MLAGTSVLLKVSGSGKTTPGLHNEGLAEDPTGISHHTREEALPTCPELMEHYLPYPEH